MDIIQDLDEIDNYFSNEQEEKQKDEKKEEIVLGIDLGTTNSCVAIWRNKNLEIIPDILNNRTLPSIVSFTKTKKYVGYEAKKQTDLNPTNTIYETKRIIGKNYSDEQVQNDLNFFTYQVTSTNQDNIIINNRYTPEEISAYILSELRIQAENYLGYPVVKAVITVPAYFTDQQREATRIAAEIAGLDCLRIINEPTAAALAYGALKKSSIKNILVYDLGGGTLDVSIIHIDDGIFEVLTSTGNTHLGGADFDNRLYTYCLNYFKNKHNISDLNINNYSKQSLKLECENAKKNLSYNTSTHIIVNNFYDNHDLMIKITKEQFEEICKDLIILCIKPVDDAIESAGLNKQDIDEIILVGGMTRVPVIKDNLKLYFNKEPCSNINPDEVVAAGAAIQAYILGNKSDPFSENILLLDITPLSLGVETIGGLMDVLIPKNSVIPIQKKRKYSTDTDYVDSVNIKIYEGERKLTKDNINIGEFILNLGEKSLRGVPEILVNFSVDANGIISVDAKDVKNGGSNNIVIRGNKNKLTKEQIKIMLEEAQTYEREDRLERERRRIIYEIDNLCNNILINLDSKTVLLKEEDKNITRDGVKSIIGWLKDSDNLDKRELLEKLNIIKRNYSTLMLKLENNGNNTVIGNHDKVSATSVFEDDIDDIDNIDNNYNNNINRNILDGDTGENKTNKLENDELKNIRDTVINTCNSLISIFKNNKKLSDDHRDDILEYINNIMIDIYVKVGLTKENYTCMLDNLNIECDKLSNIYNSNILDITSDLDKQTTLENLCYEMYTNIESNYKDSNDELVDELKDYILSSLDWILNIKIEKKRAEYEGDDDYIIDDSEYQEKIDEINKMYKRIFNNMLGD
jgi:molecular chaperone DnaK (HSP70)